MDLGMRCAGQIVERPADICCSYLTFPVSCIETRVKQLMALLEIPKSILAQQMASIGKCGCLSVANDRA